MRRRVLVLGSTGLLGSRVSSILAENSKIDLITTSRDDRKSTLKFNPFLNGIEQLLDEVKPEFVVNCIGIIPQGRARTIKNYFEMFKINSFFARKLARATSVRGISVIHPQTDAVFSGRRGDYTETSSKFPRSMYGISKLLGETKLEGQINLRCSIIGPEISGGSKSIFSWVLSMPQNSELIGYINHFWNGITTSIFARICEYLIINGPEIPSTLHLVPNGFVTKFELLKIIAEHNSRSDLKISSGVKKVSLDLRLSTNHKGHNFLVWRGIGFTSPPTIEEMLALD